MYFPLGSGDQVTAHIVSAWLRVSNVFPVAASQICTVLSSPAEAIRLPSGDHKADSTRLVWPLYTNTCCPLVASHTCTSLLAEAIRVPSGDHAAEPTDP